MLKISIDSLSTTTADHFHKNDQTTENLQAKEIKVIREIEINKKIPIPKEIETNSPKKRMVFRFFDHI